MTVLDGGEIVLDDEQEPIHLGSMNEKNGMDNSGGAGVLLRLKAVAARLGVSVRTVYRMIAEGELKLLHVRGCSCVAENDVNALIERMA